MGCSFQGSKSEKNSYYSYLWRTYAFSLTWGNMCKHQSDDLVCYNWPQQSQQQIRACVDCWFSLRGLPQTNEFVQKWDLSKKIGYPIYIKTPLLVFFGVLHFRNTQMIQMMNWISLRLLWCRTWWCTESLESLVTPPTSTGTVTAPGQNLCNLGP